MSEISRVSFGKGFHLKFSNLNNATNKNITDAFQYVGLKKCHPATMEDQFKGAKYSLDTIAYQMNFREFMMQSTDSIFSRRKFKNKFQLCKNTKDVLNINNPDIETDIYDIRSTDPNYRLLTAFIIKDKKNQAVDVFGVTYDINDKDIKSTEGQFPLDMITKIRKRIEGTKLSATSIDNDFASYPDYPYNAIMELKYNPLDLGKIGFWREKSFYKALEKLKKMITEQYSS